MKAMSRSQFKVFREKIKLLSLELEYQNSQPYQDLIIVSRIDMELDTIIKVLSSAKKLARIEESGLKMIHS